MSLQSRVRFSKAMLSVLCKCDSEEMTVYGVSSWQGGESVKLLCGMYVEGHKRVCVFFTNTVLLYVVHVQSSPCGHLWYKCGIFVNADKIG